MAALSVMGANLIDQSMVPLSLRTGATSQSDPNAGSQAPSDPAATQKPITTADKAGAGILTFLVAVGAVGGSAWLIR
jgi:mannan endo-1,6-alpha-mannosidase